MCGRKRNPKVDAKLEQNKVEAQAAKDTAQADLAAAKADALEQAKETSPAPQLVNQGQLDRQGENIFDDPQMKSMAALRRSRRAGGKGRRSLLTAKTGQGYFSRFGA